MPNMSDVENRYSEAEMAELKESADGLKKLSDWAHELACHRIDTCIANPSQDRVLTLSSSMGLGGVGSHPAFAYLDHIPDAVSELKDLRKLFLDSTKVSDLSPLRQLISLEWLDLRHTPVSDLSPLVQLASLRWLWLSNTSVSDLSPLGRLSSLERLWLSHTSVSNLSPLGQLTSLLRLDLGNTSVSDLSPLGQLTSLERLWLNSISVADLSPLGQLTSLRKLVLTDTYISDLSPLQQLDSLETLWLDNTWFSDLSPLASLSSLETLSLSHSEVSDLSPLAGLANLEYVEFNDTPVAKQDHGLKRISVIENKRERVRALVRYLNSGHYRPPPPTFRSSNSPTDLPKYGPIDPEFRDGRLRTVPRPKADTLEDYRRDAWGVMRARLEMLRARSDVTQYPDLRATVELLSNEVGEKFADFRDVAFYEALKGFKRDSARFKDLLTSSTFAHIEDIIENGEAYVVRSDDCQNWMTAQLRDNPETREKIADEVAGLIDLIENHRDLFDDRILTAAKYFELKLRIATERQQREDRDRILVEIAAWLSDVEREVRYAAKVLEEVPYEAGRSDPPDDLPSQPLSDDVHGRWEKYADMFGIGVALEGGRWAVGEVIAFAQSAQAAELLGKLQRLLADLYERAGETIGLIGLLGF